jgi:hypothetical protein
MLAHQSTLHTNVGAVLHTLDGRLGKYELTVASVTQVASRSPLFGDGTMRACPPESCKLFATIVRVLCSPPNTEAVRVAAAALSKTAGAFDHVPKLKKQCNSGLLGEAIRAAVEAAEGKSRQSTAITCSLSDTYVMRNPFTHDSFAHSFVLVVTPSEEKGHTGRLYQAYGPPDIGYSHKHCCEKGTAAHAMSPEQLVDFTNRFSKFETSTRWTPATEANYQHMFACKRRMPRNYSVECFTTVHSDVFDIEGIKTLAPLFLVPTGSTR